MHQPGWIWCVTLAALVGTTAMALQCFHCGQYNEGVGSITPCINDTYMKLKDCPPREINYCIKYISEGTIVRDCVPRCTEKDNWDWNSRTFCCQEDGCNASDRLWHSPFVTVSLILVLHLAQRLFH